MLRASLISTLAGLITLLLGANEVGDVQLETARWVFFILTSLAILTFLGALLTGRTSRT